MRRHRLAIAALLALGLSTSGCATMHSAKQDLEKLGEKMAPHARTAADKTAKATKATAKVMGRAARAGAEKAGPAMKATGKAIGRGARATASAIGSGTKATAAAIGNTFDKMELSKLERVKPWERDLHARPEMAFDPNPQRSALRSHIYFSKEASLDGGSAGGGGCGCN